MSAAESPEKAAPSSARRLSDPETEMLIAFVKKRPCLWDECHADFKNLDLRRTLWNQIGEQLYISGHTAKCKWKNLKDKFRKLQNTEELKSRCGITPAAPKWKFYNAMLFTKDVLYSELVNGSYFTSANNMVAAENNGDVSDDSDDSSSGSQSQRDEDFADITDIFSLTEKRANRRESLSPTPPRKRSQSPRARGGGTHGNNSNNNKRKKYNNGDDQVSPLEEKKIPSRNQEEKKGDDYHFLMSLLPYIESLKPIKKLELRSSIQKLVTDSYKKHVSKSGGKNGQYRGYQVED